MVETIGETIGKPFQSRKLEQPEMFSIEKIEKETENIKRFYFSGEMEARPGQFTMLWLPGVGQKPIAFTHCDRNSFSVTVSAQGKFSETVLQLEKGDRLGFQGPYGNGFSVDKGKNIILVGGGYGSSPLSFLAEVLREQKKVRFIVGAKSREELLYRYRYKNSPVEYIPCTDDGSFGEKGLATQILEKEVQKEKPDFVYTCGPEMMMKKVVEICGREGIECEASLERMMKCGIGLCGSCVLDPTGWRVCKDGPVFTGEQLKKVEDFGRFERNKTGRKKGI